MIAPDPKLIPEHVRGNPQAYLGGKPADATYMGIPIFINAHLCNQKVPVRKHKDRGEMRRNRFFKRPFVHKPSAYHTRIQKKWNKRFGMQEVGAMLMANGAVFMSPDGYNKFCAAIGMVKK